MDTEGEKPREGVDRSSGGDGGTRRDSGDRAARTDGGSSIASGGPGSLRTVVHDVRALLNGALLRADLLEMEDGSLSDDQLGHLERIRASVRQAVARLDEAVGDRPTSKESRRATGR